MHERTVQLTISYIAQHAQRANCIGLTRDALVDRVRVQNSI